MIDFDAPGLPTWIRLLVGLIAVVHALLCARVVLTRIARRREPAHPERVPTAAMLSYLVTTGFIAEQAFDRVPGGQPLDLVRLAVYGAVLGFGTFAFAQIVYLTRDSRRAARDARRR